MFDQNKDSPARSRGVQTRSPQVIWSVDLEACGQDRVITERAHYAIPPPFGGMKGWRVGRQRAEEESAPGHRQPRYQTVGGDDNDIEKKECQIKRERHSE